MRHFKSFESYLRKNGQKRRDLSWSTQLTTLAAIYNFAGALLKHIKIMMDLYTG